MPRIGLVIRDAYRRPGTEDLAEHVARHYGIAVTGSKTIAAGVVRIDRSDGPAWIARRMASTSSGSFEISWATRSKPAHHRPPIGCESLPASIGRR